MSIQDRDRLKVLHEVKKRHVSQKQGASELGVSARWVRELLKRLREEGDGAFCTGCGGADPTARLPRP